MLYYLIYQILNTVKQAGRLMFKKLKTVFLFSSLLFFTHLNGISQTSTIDSLKQVLSNSTDDSKAVICMSIAKEYKSTNYDSVVFYANKASDYVVFLEDNNVLIESLIELGFINLVIGNLESSLFLYDQAKQLSLKEDNHYFLAKIYLGLERYYNRLSDYASSLSSLDTALAIINDNNISSLKPIIYNTYGRLYFSIQDFPLAHNYTNLALSYSKNETDKTNYIKNILLTGRIFLHTNKLDSSFYYFNQALSDAKKENDKILIQQAYRHISEYYINKTEYDNAICYIDSSIQYCNELVLLTELAPLITIKAYIFARKGDYRSTLNYNLQALEIRKKIGIKVSICSSLLNVGSNYTKLKEYENAHLYLNQGIEMAESLQSFYFLAYGYDKLSDLYKLEGDFEKALYYTELKTQYNDSIRTSKTNEKVMLFKNQFELEKIKTLSEKIKLKKKSEELFFLIYTIILSAGLIILLMWVNYSRKKTTKEIIKAKEQVEESEEKYRNLIESMSDGIYRSTHDGRFIEVNPAMVRILGYNSKEELLAVDIKTQLYFSEEERESADLEEKLEEMAVFRLRKKDGAEIWVEDHGRHILDYDGNVLYHEGSLRDVTDRILAEQELRESEAKLKEINSTKDKFFSIIAHDLKTPFNAIVGFSNILVEQVRKKNYDEIEEFAGIIEQSSHRAMDLLTNLMEWSRSQTGRIEFNPEYFEMISFINETLLLFGDMAQQKTITITTDLPANAPVFADKSMISTVLRNLISNALKFTYPGGKIIISIKKNKGELTASVSDNGVGISKNKIQKIFKVEETFSTTGTNNEQGTGLGLILCKEFVEKHSGNIWAESEEGNGSTIYFTLPDNKLPKVKSGIEKR